MKTISPTTNQEFLQINLWEEKAGAKTPETKEPSKNETKQNGPSRIIHLHWIGKV